MSSGSIIDLLVISIYLGATIAIGIGSRGKQQGAKDYFTASGGMSGGLGTILVGLSIAATFFSGISFVAIPGIVFREGPNFVFALICLPICWIILRYLFLPRFLRIAEGEPYYFLEKQLGSSIRTQVSILYVLLRIGWMATLIYAPTLAIVELLGVSENWLPLVIIALGLVSTLYTAIGGLRGVIVTDALQFAIIAIGVFLTVAIILFRLPASVPEVWQELRGQDLIQFPRWTLNFSDFYSWWSILLGFGFSYLATYLADQMSLQRYLAAGTVRSANRSFVFNIIGVFVVLFLLIAVGLSLRAFYHYYPAQSITEQPDRVFPFFVANELPTGLSGLIIAILLAATMSSITSGINALASVITIDLWASRLKKESRADEKKLLRASRYVTLALGILCTALALFVNRLGSLFEATQAILGLFLGPILAAVFFAIIGIRITGRTYFVSVLSAVLIGILLMQQVANIWATFLTTSFTTLFCLIGFYLSPRKNRAAT
ncbi:MAG: sodium:solute symporter family transporter [Puniceicoccales bacterium]